MGLFCVSTLPMINKYLAAIKYFGLDEAFRLRLNEYIKDIGGYEANDAIAKYNYISINFPQMIT